MKRVKLFGVDYCHKLNDEEYEWLRRFNNNFLKENKYARENDIMNKSTCSYEEAHPMQSPLVQDDAIDKLLKCSESYHEAKMDLINEYDKMLLILQTSGNLEEKKQLDRELERNLYILKVRNKKYVEDQKNRRRRRDVF